MAPDDRPGKGQTVLVVQEGPGKVVSFSTLNPSHRVVIDVGEKPHEIELAPDGRTAADFDRDGRLDLVVLRRRLYYCFT